jgi:hypothetical protein
MESRLKSGTSAQVIVGSLVARGFGTTCQYPKLVDISDIINRDCQASLGRWDLGKTKPLFVSIVKFFI